MAMLRGKGDIRASSESDVWFFSLSHTKNSVSSLDDGDRFPHFPRVLETRAIETRSDSMRIVGLQIDVDAMVAACSIASSCDGTNIKKSFSCVGDLRKIKESEKKNRQWRIHLATAEFFGRIMTAIVYG